MNLFANTATVVNPPARIFQTEYQRVFHTWRRHHRQHDHGQRRRGLQRHSGGDGRQLWPEDTSHSQPTGASPGWFQLLSWLACQQAAGVQGHLGRRTHAHSFVVSNPRQEFERQIKEWCKEAGEDITYEFAQVCERGAARNVIPPLAWC